MKKPLNYEWLLLIQYIEYESEQITKQEQIEVCKVVLEIYAVQIQIKELIKKRGDIFS